MEQLKKLRAEKGLSQARLASRAGIDPSTANQIERGAREPSPASLR
jgi:transcriptional regulator with XRE-family HTH domain